MAEADHGRAKIVAVAATASLVAPMFVAAGFVTRSLVARGTVLALRARIPARTILGRCLGDRRRFAP